MAERGLARAAQRLAGDVPADVCAALAVWRARQQRELPWLAGPAFSALARLSAPPPSSASVKVLERFLIGVETDEQAVLAAIDRCVADAGDLGEPFPPDARGALVDAVERFFDLLSEAYGELSVVVRDGHRRYADQTVQQWQPRLDAAVADIDERAKVVVGTSTRIPRPPPAKRRRGTKDRPAVAFVFVVLALMTAAVVLYMVLNGWPMEPFQFTI